MEELFIVTQSSDVEYWCQSCGQLRLWCRPEPLNACGNCGAAKKKLVIGKPGELDVTALRSTRQKKEGKNG